ncbi:MAG: S-layer protein, partial [Nanoarchaeota archaeon]|nr:S-layer protein [Nanoarchaeota archaeon]
NATILNMTLDIVGDVTADLPENLDDMDIAWGLASGVFNKLGATSNTEEGKELLWGPSDINLGTKDEDHRSNYGIIIKNPKSNGASDRVEFSIPQDQVFANIVIKGSSSTVSSGSTSYTSSAVTPVTKLASEVTTASDYNLILLGGPCANYLVEDLFDMTCDGWSFESGEAVVKLVDNGDKVALLVAGTSADDTRRAAKALAGYADYSLSGTEVLVSGTSLTDINIGEVVAAEEVVAEEEVVA